MELNSRAFMILEMLTKQKKISADKLKQDVKLTNRQLEYDLHNIDAYLKNNGYEPIKREDKGILYASQNVHSLLSDIRKKEKIINLSSTERKYTIILYLFINNEVVSLFHISSFLKVSKNTVL